MTRPCDCGRFVPGEYRPGDCRLCWLYAHREDYRRLWDGPPPAPAPVPLPCVHEGPPVRGPAAPDLVRDYLRCGAGLGDPPGVVCRCHCGPGCGRYEADG